MSLFWNSTFGTGARYMQGLARMADYAAADAGTYFADDGSTYTIDPNGTVVTATPATDGTYPQVVQSGGYGPGAAASGSIWGGATATGANSAPDFWSGAIASARDLAMTILQGKQAYDINQLNMQLVKAGRAPLSASQLKAIAPTVNFGVSSDTQKMIMYGGIALAAALVLPKLMK